MLYNYVFFCGGYYESKSGTKLLIKLIIFYGFPLFSLRIFEIVSEVGVFIDYYGSLGVYVVLNIAVNYVYCIGLQSNRT